ncbi:hypothetical protein Tco_1343921 [Tanacetum coccineum]
MPGAESVGVSDYNKVYMEGVLKRGDKVGDVWVWLELRLLDPSGKSQDFKGNLVGMPLASWAPEVHKKLEVRRLHIGAPNSGIDGRVNSESTLFWKGLMQRVFDESLENEEHLDVSIVDVRGVESDLVAPLEEGEIRDDSVLVLMMGALRIAWKRIW